MSQSLNSAHIVGLDERGAIYPWFAKYRTSLRTGWPLSWASLARTRRRSIASETIISLRTRCPRASPLRRRDSEKRIQSVSECLRQTG
jgi:hypothetical protein